MQYSIATLYGHSADTVEGWKNYSDKLNQLIKWRSGFIERVRERSNNFMQSIYDRLNAKIDYVVNNYYDSSSAGERWREAVESLEINRQCQNFIKGIGEEATDKMRELSDELTQDLKYSGTTFEAPKFSVPDLDDTQGTIMTLAPFLVFTPVGLVGAAVVGLGAWLFGDSRSEKNSSGKEETSRAT